MHKDRMTVSDGKTESSELILHADLNSMGNLFGGRLVSMIDKVAAISAIKHTRGPVVTISIDSLVFRRPVTNGSIVTLKASVNRAFSHSLEVGVIAMTLPPGATEAEKVCSAYLSFVALDEDGKPRPVHDVITETEEEKRRWQQALIRRNHRLSLRDLLDRGEGCAP